MDPGLRDRLRSRTDGRSPEEIKSNRKTVLIAGAAIAALLAIGGRLSWPGHLIHFDSRHHDQAKGPVSIEADQLYQAYRDDPEEAAKRFGGREMVVSGNFSASCRTAGGASICA